MILQHFENKGLNGYNTYDKICNKLNSCDVTHFFGGIKGKVKKFDKNNIKTGKVKIWNQETQTRLQYATNNAKKVIAWKKKYGSEVKGMTQVGWTRAGQLARREKLSRSTIARMASFKRHQKNAAIDPKYKATPWKDKGYVAWLGWGGASGVEWAIRKLKTIDNKKK